MMFPDTNAGGAEMSQFKHALSVLLVFLIATVFTADAAADASYRSVEISGKKYLIEDPAKFYAPDKIAYQAETLYASLANHPTVRTYVYLVNSSRTVNVLEDVSAEPKIYQDIRSFFSNSVTDFLRITSLEEYGQYFYTTDHHWNYQGSYVGYCQIVHMLLGDDEPVIKPEKSVSFPVTFNGSLNKNIHKNDSTEYFSVYRFSYPEMKIEINGKPRDKYGNQEAYFDGRYSKAAYANHYNSFYGGEEGLIHVETNRTDHGNLVVFSNSQSDAINLLLASHFHHTYIVDLRHYMGGTGHCHFSNMVEKWHPDQVLILGDGLYFKLDYGYQ